MPQPSNPPHTQTPPGCYTKQSGGIILVKIQLRGNAEELVHGFSDGISERIVVHPGTLGVCEIYRICKPSGKSAMFSFKFREMLYHISGVIQIKEKPAHITVCKIDNKVYKKGSVFFQLHHCVFLLAAHSSGVFHGSSCFTICSSVKSAVFAVFSSYVRYL